MTPLRITHDSTPLDLPDFQPDLFDASLGEHVGTQGWLFGKPPTTERQVRSQEGQGDLFAGE